MGIYISRGYSTDCNRLLWVNESVSCVYHSFKASKHASNLCECANGARDKMFRGGWCHKHDQDRVLTLKEKGHVNGGWLTGWHIEINARNCLNGHISW